MKPKNGGYNKNKKVHRRENKKGDFTTINYAILRDKRLTPNAKLLLIEILSDTDNFKFSEQLFINRMGITKKTLYRAMDNLKENGYLKSTKIKNTKYNYYTISEFGNLNSKEETEQETEPAKKLNTNVEDYSKETDFIYKNLEFICSELTKTIVEVMEDKQYQLLPDCVKIIQDRKKKHYNDIKGFIENVHRSEEVKKLAIKILKERIFEKNQHIDSYYRTIHAATTQINRKKPLDRESLWADKMDGV